MQVVEFFGWATLGAVAGGCAFFVVGEEGCFFEAGPEGVAFGGKGFDLVEVGLQGEGGVAVSGAEPIGEGGGGAGQQRDDGRAPEGAVGFLVIREGVVAGDAEEHGRDAQCQRDLAGGGVFGVDEVEFGGRQRERLPVETAFEEERASGVFRALEALLEFGFEALELFGRQTAFAGGVDEGAGGAGGVSAELSEVRAEQRLVPLRRLIVDVDGNGGGLDGEKQ